MIDGTFKKPNYTLIRDLFIFCTFTGLSWTDMANLTQTNLQTSFDGHLWLNTKRQKTGVRNEYPAAGCSQAYHREVRRHGRGR